MGRMLARVEVQRVLILAFVFCAIACAIARAPFGLLVLLAAAATAWTLVLGWSLTLDSAVARGARVASGAAAAAACAAAFGAAAPAVAVFALVAGVLLAGTERALRRRAAVTAAIARERSPRAGVVADAIAPATSPSEVKGAARLGAPPQSP